MPTNPAIEERYRKALADYRTTLPLDLPEDEQRRRLVLHLQGIVASDRADLYRQTAARLNQIERERTWALGIFQESLAQRKLEQVRGQLA